MGIERVCHVQRWHRWVVVTLWGWVRVWVLGMLCCFPTHAAEISGMQVDRKESGVYLSAQVYFELPAVVVEAAHRGVPLYFVAHAEVLRDRWYWWDRSVAQAFRYMRLSYQPLTSRWRLQTAPQPLTSASQGLTLSETFEDLDQALGMVRRITRWKIAPEHNLDDGARYNVNFRFSLDVGLLPRPLQGGWLDREDWELSVSRNQRLQ